MPRNRRSARIVVGLDCHLANSEVACLLEAPLLDGGEGDDLCLDSDQWVALLSARRQAGRPVHFVEVARAAA